MQEKALLIFLSKDVNSSFLLFNISIAYNRVSDGDANIEIDVWSNENG